MNSVIRRTALVLGVVAVALVVSLTVAPEAKAKAPVFNPWSPGPAQGVWSGGPNQFNWRAGPYGAQYNWDNNGGFFSQTYRPGGRKVYEQNQFFRGQRTVGPGGNHGWVESPFLPGARLTW